MRAEPPLDCVTPGRLAIAGLWEISMKNHPIQIVAANYADAEHRAVIPNLLNAYAKDLLGFRKALDEPVLQNLVSGLEAFPTAIVLLARVEEAYVGLAICFLGFSTFNAQPLINIHDFMVLKAYRNRGIGKALLWEVERIARERKCCKITLEVQMKNTAARGIYQSFGFKASFLDPEAGEQLSLTKTLFYDDC
jgi:ribosomal protein S18 acetylase RimI-like enzyme